MRYTIILFILIASFFLSACNDEPTVTLKTSELEIMLKEARGSSFTLGIAVAQMEIVKKRNPYVDSKELEKICIGELSKMNIRNNFLFRGEK